MFVRIYLNNRNKMVDQKLLSLDKENYNGYWNVTKIVSTKVNSQ